MKDLIRAIVFTAIFMFCWINYPTFTMYCIVVCIVWAAIHIHNDNGEIKQ